MNTHYPINPSTYLVLGVVSTIILVVIILARAAHQRTVEHVGLGAVCVVVLWRERDGWMNGWVGERKGEN